MTDKEALLALRDPYIFIEKIWGLKPQKILSKYEKNLYACRRTGDYRGMQLGMFETYERGKHITWQQAEIVRAVNYARLGIKKPQISIASGHGIGKSTIMAMLILWFLFVHPDCKIGATAPTQNQMYDVLWAEIKKWIEKMPPFIANKYEHSNDYVRIKESPENWFARARTARKEAPEALAGLHADHIMIVVDEASGVPDVIFEASKSAMTNSNILFLMISNPTRPEGYFFDSHHKLKSMFQVLMFSSEESPEVDTAFVESIIEEHGKESDQFRYRVAGSFPLIDTIDDKGYMPVYNFDLLPAKNNKFLAGKIMGIDPGGQGNDISSIVIRDSAKAWVVATEKKSTSKSLANLVATILMTHPCDAIVYDNFGEGANLGVELAKMGIHALGLNVGDPSEVEGDYLNMRAYLYWSSRQWCREGGEVSNAIRQEAQSIKYKMTLRGKIQIMSKDEMRKRGIQSPNNMDAFSLTFARKIRANYQKVQKTSPLSAPTASKKRYQAY